MFISSSLRGARSTQDCGNVDSSRTVRTMELEVQPNHKQLRCPGERLRFLLENPGHLSLSLSPTSPHTHCSFCCENVQSPLINLKIVTWNSMGIKLQSVQTLLSATVRSHAHLLHPSCRGHCFLQSANAVAAAPSIVTIV